MAVTPFKSSDNFNMAGFNEKITEADNTYVAKTGDSMTGALSMGNNKITDVASPTSAGDAANKEYIDGALNEKVYDYLSEFNIPKTISNCNIKSNIISGQGTAVVYNYIGFSIVRVNITKSANGFGDLYKSNDTFVKPGYIGSSQTITYIHSGVTTQDAITSGDRIQISFLEAGVSKYLFPFNLI